MPHRDVSACESARRRALELLSREVPKWSRENNCFSCHNNGDGARALYRSIRLGIDIDSAAVDQTTRWLATPRQWKENGGEGPFNDRRLAIVQFASALHEAVRSGVLRDSTPLLHAAELLAAEQDEVGAWLVEPAGLVGSPATYGPFLATLTARDVLIAADPVRFQRSIAAADRWLKGQQPNNVFEAAVLLMAFARETGPDDVARRRQCLELIRTGQATSGGWGPFANSAPEPFDTALVLVALGTVEPADAAIKQSLWRGRKYLMESQQPDGSWPETTRPANSESYAQRISTTAWATMALLETTPAPPPRATNVIGR